MGIIKHALEHIEEPLLDEDIDRWLQNMGVIYWVKWDITDPKERAEAVRWFRATLMDFLAFE